ncbi:hypothetical protein GGR16_001695 [Chelatococcus caeni]|uniref:Uncharacterized protein n=2 Tax=Chelatococcus TaxID=28209 RepID=A0A840BZH4_9HYPH|nr:hypothetical protein [Chelatococcus caeni]MBB4016689.1 hypothetical protein [Chelatococcus caeni]
MATWGMPTPPERIRGNYDPGLTFAAACAAHGWTRNQCTEELRVPRSTYDKWCDGGKCDREASRRRLMSLIDQTTP